MATRGNGYGSEDHLIQYWTNRRGELEVRIRETVRLQGRSLEWIYPTPLDGSAREPEGLAFLRDSAELLTSWSEFWPQTGTQQCWDAVARLTTDAGVEWILIEAKANHPEFCTPPCGAAKHGGRPLIERALNAAKHHLGVHLDFSWLGSYYQHANRLATLYFLTTHGIRAHLVDVLFVGDVFPDHRRCPQDEREWRELLRARQLTLGLPDRHALSEQVHELFLPVLQPVASTSSDGG